MKIINREDVERIMTTNRNTSSEELLSISENNDRTSYREEAFIAIQKILKLRGINLFS